MEFATWAEDQWKSMSDYIKTTNSNLDICSQYNSLTGEPESESSIGQKTIKSSDPSLLLPLHDLIKVKEGEHAIGMVITFKKRANLTKTSEIKFYSDPKGADLLCTINAGSEGKTLLPPLTFNHGQVWFHYDPGTTAILPLHEQSDSKSELPC